MEKTIQKYTERLATLKENRARTVDTNTDAENELYDQLIKQVAEFIRDTKQLNIADVSKSLFILLDQDNDVITPLFKNEESATKYRKAIIEEGNRQSVTINKIDVSD